MFDKKRTTMKKITLFFSLLILGVGITAFTSSKEKTNITTSESGIQFTTISFQEALKLAKKEKKNIFLDAYASWCRPCKMLKNNIFTKQHVGEFYNKNFINLAIDMEQGEGPQLARKYRVQAYPTLLYINENGEVIGNSVGYIEDEELISIGKKYVK
jgi:thioredoxin 1